LIFKINQQSHAAVVVDEAARLSLGQRWTQASALTPKVPAQFQVSPQNAQTHCLSNQSMQCLEEKMHRVRFVVTNSTE